MSILGVVNTGTRNVEGYLLLPLFLGDLFIEDKIGASYFWAMLRISHFHAESIFNRSKCM